MKNLKYLLNSFLFILIIYCNSSGQENTSLRPKIGLVLSGGAAKGLAHIGVLKVLEEAGIRPDYIAGSSMGGIVGGLYSIGYSADSLHHIARSLKWSYYLSDDIPRRSITLEEKEDYDRFVLSIPIADRGIQIPGGVINGQNIENLLNQLCAPVYSESNFSEFQIPFVCNATDIETGKEVVFRNGYLPDALRATMSIPSIFHPIELNGTLLVDGGLISNLPAGHLKKMGADIIIGVDVGFQSYPKEQLNSLFRIIEQSLRFYSEDNSTQNTKLCNILITPSLKNYNAGSFGATDSIIALGEMAARKLFPQLKALADSLKELDPSFGIRPETSFPDSLFLTEISVEGLNNVSGELLKGKLQLSVMEKTTPREIGAAVDRLYSSLYFEKVSYRLENSDKGVRLILNVIENSEGYLRFGLHYDSYIKSSVLLNATFRNLLLDGSKFSINGMIGDNPLFKTEFFKNNGWKPGFGLAFQSSRSEGYFYRDERKVSSLNFYETKFQLYTQSVFRNSTAIGGGVEFENSLLRPNIGMDVNAQESRYKLINYYAYLNLDNYNHRFFPTQGFKFTSRIKFITSEELTPVTFFYGKISKAQKLSSRISLINHIYAGLADGDSIPSQYLLFTGGNVESYRNGAIPFAGLNYMEIASRNALALKMDLQLRLFDNIYVTGTVNAGNFTYRFNDLFTTDKILSGYGLSAGYDSLVGPIELSISRSANRGGFEGFVRIGCWF